MLEDHEQGLTTITGKKLAEVAGYVSAEYGDDTLVFVLTRIMFDDGTALEVDGEHELPFIPNDERTQALFRPHHKPD